MWNRRWGNENGIACHTTTHTRFQSFDKLHLQLNMICDHQSLQLVSCYLSKAVKIMTLITKRYQSPKQSNREKRNNLNIS